MGVSLNSLGSLQSLQSLVPFLIALSFAAGLNVYATTLTLGTLARLHWVTLPGTLGVLASPWMLAASAVLFACELFADKIPYVDLVWNFAHTFVRIPIAALLAFSAGSHLSPQMQLLVTALGGTIAMISHGSKTAARTLVSASPEPLSNIALSSSEDVAAIGLTWVATRHPVAAGVAAGAAAIFAILMVRWIVQKLGKEWRRVRERFTNSSDPLPEPSSAGSLGPG